MNGAIRIQRACCAWYLLCVMCATPAVIVAAAIVDGGGEHIRGAFVGIGLCMLGSIPFVFLIHLLAAILGAIGSLEAKVDSYSKWFVDRALESAAPPSTPPPPTVCP